MTFTREHHRIIAVALGCLNAPMLREARCYFAGGTALAMRFGEYRESVDIDFIVADGDSYRTLRTACRGPKGFTAFTIPGQRVVEAGDLRIDQYGIRTRLSVATATVADLVATTLLANSDRWADPTVFNRDIIDLAMIQAARPTLALGLRKATTAYGSAVAGDAQAAIGWLLGRDHAIDRCLQALGMTGPRAVLVDRLRRLATALTREMAAPDERSAPFDAGEQRRSGR